MHVQKITVDDPMPKVGKYGGHNMSLENEASIISYSANTHTLSSLIKSAVSSSVNLPISDTIPSIFGLVAATASVDCHLLDAVRRSVEVHWRVLRE